MTALYTRTPVRCAAMRSPNLYNKTECHPEFISGSLEVLYKIFYQEMLNPPGRIANTKKKFDKWANKFSVTALYTCIPILLRSNAGS